MKTFNCICGNRLYFENSQCLGCGRHSGWCPGCRAIVGLEPAGPDLWRCGNARCGTMLAKCHNYAVRNVCNRCLVVVTGPDGTAAPMAGDALCDYCALTVTIPDLSKPGNHEKWYRLEVAKRRLLYSMDLIGVPYGGPGSACPLPLSFDFLEDEVVTDRTWQSMGEVERVFTGHDNGRITINIREADDVERERLRVDFQEAHRTLIGHLRHEIGHYFWQLLVYNHDEDRCARVFGDHRAVDYGQAMQWYYQNGPMADWRGAYVSAYATMHPWEDFAETFATYLDMISVLDTASNMGLGGPGVAGDFDLMIEHYRHLGLVMNEMNRSMGLTDLVPEVITDAIARKIHYIHELVRSGACVGGVS
ncbi:MAG: putative zinc-binding metallopeptidase [Phycisphaeraceae bacterium]|nr:putative zinc-binding metallopeptidase [Phycisphaeraceae bacterium]